MSKSFYKRIFVSYANNTFISDDGWIFADESRVIHYSQIGEVKSEIISYTEGLTPLGAFTFDSPKLVDKINRSYMKVQDLAAKIGGLANSIFIVVRLISASYLRFLYIGNLYDLTRRYDNTTKEITRRKSEDPSRFSIKTENNINDVEAKAQVNELKVKPIPASTMRNIRSPSIELDRNSFAKKPTLIDDFEFNYFFYLKSLITCEDYKKQLNERVAITKEKMGIETLSRAMNYFYIKGKENS